MRKMFSLALAMVFTLLLSTAAFAGTQSDEFVFYGDSQIGSISDGQDGYSWNHSSDRDNYIVIKRVYHKFRNDWRHLHIYISSNGKVHYYRDRYDHGKWHDYDNDELYFYVDDNGVSHYFYLDPDRDYEVHQYRDKDGVTQFYFEDQGWK